MGGTKNYTIDHSLQKTSVSAELFVTSFPSSAGGDLDVAAAFQEELIFFSINRHLTEVVSLVG